MHAELRTREALGPLGPVEEKNAPDVLYTAGDTSLLTEGSRKAAPTVDQNLDGQIEALAAAGCGVVRQEQRSGATLEGRPELKTILDFIHPGETLVVTRIDRLARSMQDLQTIVARLKEKGAHLAATEQPVDTSTAAGKAFFDMLGVFAEFETNLRRERQAEGIKAAKRKGVYRGRPPKIDPAQDRYGGHSGQAWCRPLPNGNCPRDGSLARYFL